MILSSIACRFWPVLICPSLLSLSYLSFYHTYHTYHTLHELLRLRHSGTPDTKIILSSIACRFWPVLICFYLLSLSHLSFYHTYHTYHTLHGLLRLRHAGTPDTKMILSSIACRFWPVLSSFTAFSSQPVL